MVTPKMKAQIWSRQYFDLASLLFWCDSPIPRFRRWVIQGSPMSGSLRRSRFLRSLFGQRPSSYTLTYTASGIRHSHSLFAYLPMVQSLSDMLPNWLSFDTKFRALQATEDLHWTPVHLPIMCICYFGGPKSPLKDVLISYHVIY